MRRIREERERDSRKKRAVREKHAMFITAIDVGTLRRDNLNRLYNSNVMGSVF
jgi:hypothetical protein